MGPVRPSLLQSRPVSSAVQVSPGKHVTRAGAAYALAEEGAPNDGNAQIAHLPHDRPHGLHVLIVDPPVLPADVVLVMQDHPRARYDLQAMEVVEHRAYEPGSAAQVSDVPRGDRPISL